MDDVVESYVGLLPASLRQTKRLANSCAWTTAVNKGTNPAVEGPLALALL